MGYRLASHFPWYYNNPYKQYSVSQWNYTKGKEHLWIEDHHLDVWLRKHFKFDIHVGSQTQIVQIWNNVTELMDGLQFAKMFKISVGIGVCQLWFET